MKKKLPKNIEYDGADPEDTWLEKFTAFLDRHEHVETRNGKAYLAKGGKKKKIKMVDN